MHKSIALLTAAASVVLIGHCPAATVVWTPATNVVAATDVLAIGSTVAAANFGPTGTPSAVVNGVTFAAFPVANSSNNLTVGTLTLRETQTNLISYASAPNAAPFSTLPAGYRALLGAGAGAGIIESLQITVTGLTVGGVYNAQPFATFSDAIASDAQLQIVGGPLLEQNVSNTAGGLGQYSVGTFVADAATQVFTFNGAGDYAGLGALPFIAGFQLRAVPEPASIALAAVAAGLTLARRRRA